MTAALGPQGRERQRDGREAGPAICSLDSAFTSSRVFLRALPIPNLAQQSQSGVHADDAIDTGPGHEPPDGGVDDSHAVPAEPSVHLRFEQVKHLSLSQPFVGWLDPDRLPD